MSRQKKPLIGLTGGIGSGKSSAATYFSGLGVDVIDADQASREVVKVGSFALSNITDYFGADILETDGSLNRSKLRHVVFSDPTKRKWLQSLMYPITNDYLINEIKRSASPYTILMNPLLVESRQHQWCDRVAVIDVSLETQIHRTMNRDDNTREQVESIIGAQVDRAKRLEYADDVVNNDEPPGNLEKQIKQLHQSYLKL